MMAAKLVRFCGNFPIWQLCCLLELSWISAEKFLPGWGVCCQQKFVKPLFTSQRMKFNSYCLMCFTAIARWLLQSQNFLVFSVHS